MSQLKNILIINCGSSTIKFQVIDMSEEKTLMKGAVEAIGEGHSCYKIKNIVSGDKKTENVPIENHEEGLSHVFNNIPSAWSIDAVGHRVVHGGAYFSDAILLDEDNIKKIENCIPLAPLHNPANISGIRAAMKLLPNVPHVGSFDTAFHQSKGEDFFMYALPVELYEKHQIRKYGFHGASHKFVAHRAAEMLDKDIKNLKLISCHLGNGSTVTAVDKGIAIETTATFGTFCGLPMGTRAGDIDPAIILHLIDTLGYSTKEIHKMLYKQSGLLGVSGISNDMRQIREAAKEGNKRAQLARNLYIMAIRKYIGAFAGLMNGVDAVIFTAGIGENDEPLRQIISESISYLGAEYDHEKNSVQGEEAIFSTGNSKVKLMVIPTQEELMIARETIQTAS